MSDTKCDLQIIIDYVDGMINYIHKNPENYCSTLFNEMGRLKYRLEHYYNKNDDITKLYPIYVRKCTANKIYKEKLKEIKEIIER